ncbi:MAG: DUF177 domain-containing protein [Bacteroides sp.]|nr:DUF177 domain-containing protein [Bacteroides sp.]
MKIIPNFAQFFQSSLAVGKFTEFKLALKSLPVGTHHFEFHLGKEFFVNMESADVHDADLTVNLDVVHKNDAYDMTFAITGTVTLICDRCLDNLVMPMEAEYHVTVEYGDDYNDETDDLLIIPQSDNYLNVAYMIYDTVALAIPIKHVHPLGKCNRAMSAVLKKHRATPAGAGPDADMSLEEALIDEMDGMEPDADTDDAPEQPSDPRWDELKKLKDNN